MVRQTLWAFFAPFLLVSVVVSVAGPPARAQETLATPPIVHKVKGAHEQMEMTVNTSRILALDKKIPQAQVNNPEILTLTPLSPTQVQMAAKSPGVTQVNLWDEDQKIHTIDVIVFADARELQAVLNTQFPDAALKVVPIASGVMISGHVDRPEHVSLIVRIAEEYYPKVLNNITVGGVQQVLLHIKVMEVSRTKLRALGFDFSKVTGSNIVASSVSGVLAAGSAAAASGLGTGRETFRFNIVDGSNAFYGLMEALREDGLMKILAEPTLVTVSGRPAFFQVGGEVPTLVPQSLGTISVEYKKYGTQVDFVPIVLGNDEIRLEVRPRVSDIDTGRSVEYQGYTIYAFKTREVDTGVEMKAGQTLAIAGLVQNRLESSRRGIPWVGELPYLGAMFRKMQEQQNEIELLILVTPEVVDAIDPHAVSQCGPGMMTASPNDWQLYMRGHLEVPNCCPACSGAGCPQCEGTIQEGSLRPIPDTPPGMILEEVEPVETPQPKPTEAEPQLQPPAQPRPDASTSSNPKRFPSRAVRIPPPSKPHDPSNRTARKIPGRSKTTGELPGIIGPVGYDVVQ